MLSRTHWYFVILLGLTFFGSSYFFFAVPSQKSIAPVYPSSLPEPTVSSGGKADCGDGICVSPENSDRCPVDCSL